MGWRSARGPAIKQPGLIINFTQLGVSTQCWCTPFIPSCAITLKGVDRPISRLGRHSTAPFIPLFFLPNFLHFNFNLFSLNFNLFSLRRLKHGGHESLSGVLRKSGQKPMLPGFNRGTSPGNPYSLGEPHEFHDNPGQQPRLWQHRKCC